MAYKVTAPLVVALVGGRVQHLYLGDVVPSGIDSTSLENLKSLGFVSKDADPVPAEPEAPTAERPPEAGPGSAKEKWFAFAAFHNVEVAADASKDDVIAAVTAAGH